MKPPPRQSHYQDALRLAMETVRGCDLEALALLGAREVEPGHLEIRVLDQVFCIDLETGNIVYAGESTEKIREEWKILTLHYLSSCPPPISEQEELPRIAFAEIPDGLGYASVFQGRVIGRFCGTVARERESFAKASVLCGGEAFSAGDAAFRFRVFPRLVIGIVWYAGDDEFPPGASFLFPSNVLSFLAVEDVVVLCESLVGRLHAVLR